MNKASIPAPNLLLTNAPAQRAAALIVIAWMLMFTGTCLAQQEPGYAKKTGVSDPGLKHPMSELTPDAVFPVSGHPDWMEVTEDAVWVASSSANHVVRLDATTNKPDAVITVAKP